jgi:hypothetical protein
MADDYALFCVVIASPGERYKLIFEPAGTGNTVATRPISSSRGNLGLQDPLYRPLREVSSGMDVDIVCVRSPDPLAGAPESMIATRRSRFRTVPYPQSLETTLRRPYTLWIPSLLGRLYSRTILGLGISSCPGTLTVRSGKVYRPLREGISSAPGTLTVRSGKV